MLIYRTKCDDFDNYVNAYSDLIIFIREYIAVFENHGLNCIYAIIIKMFSIRKGYFYE